MNPSTNNTYYTMTQTNPLNASWQPDAIINNKIRSSSELTSNWKYRQYIQKNANQIMKYNTMQTINDSGNNPYSVLNTDPTNNNPYLYSSTHDTNNPVYGFRNSDLKQDYMKKQQMKAKMIAPFISTNMF